MPDQTKKKGFPWKKWLTILVLTPIILFALYTWFVLSWSYSNGERAGFVQKLSKQGWLIKTWEGELSMVNVPGAMQEKFYFSVRNDEVAAKINQHLGKRVALVYEQHVGVPTSAFGNTSYFVVDVKVLEQ